jgi:hypothetical protein
LEHLLAGVCHGGVDVVSTGAAGGLPQPLADLAGSFDGELGGAVAAGPDPPSLEAVGDRRIDRAVGISDKEVALATLPFFTTRRVFFPSYMRLPRI